MTCANPNCDRNKLVDPPLPCRCVSETPMSDARSQELLAAMDALIERAEQGMLRACGYDHEEVARVKARLAARRVQ